MEKPIIKIENLSKQYRLGTIGTGTLSHDINRWWHTVRGKEDPYLKVGEANDRSKKGNSEYVWALKDLNFEVKQGEILGIIGKNGAGKSTLLKLLSRVTAPTTGKITCHGRIASLLEVGTGFHPELTGRENIYLNGAILGMTKKEIASKFEEIVDFAGCENYIETPVKRYSSGMYVRLAFAVAAHLEPDILVVDEVLAVGDAEFQKKAIGKMQEVSQGQGRTVIFVSHNMASIRSLCTNAIVMENGKCVFSGSTNESVEFYLENNKMDGLQTKYTSTATTTSDLRIKQARIFPKNGQILVGEKLSIDTEIESDTENLVNLHLGIYKMTGEKILHLSNIYDKHTQTIRFSGVKNLVCTIPNLNLSPGFYTINLSLHKDNQRHQRLESSLSFQVVENDFYKIGKIPPSNEAVFLIDQDWK
ncbi:ABC transporter ATP-binding protein [Psychroserpens sp. Hel_I_66]|uniref:ABC transporter ATP-binding protein n=1 Tax=Psychroserpens sp. Hel_I_66 TaxID=1250004 RepID=UPI000648E751|nr:ABC transporter ATP-binding protein [Psychroserpens sp. Hel_I_66]